MVITTFLMTVFGSSPAWSDDWKYQIDFPDDPFCAPAFGGDSGWVKFTIKLDAPGTVYFQDSQLYVLHYDFATSVLEPFIGMSAGEYYMVTLYDQGQQAALGTYEFAFVYLGDLDGDHDVDFADFAIFANNWLKGVE